MKKIWSIAAVGLVGLAACGGDDERRLDSAAGTAVMDTTRASARGPTAGPAPAPSADDPDVVRQSLELELTDENIGKFVRASESLALVRARDPNARARLERFNSTDASAGNDGTLESLERDSVIAGVLSSAGLSVRDYMALSIAIASAQRFADRPQDAPPTGSARENAEVVRRNRAALAKLRVWGG
jgi:hypothetical protein